MRAAFAHDAVLDMGLDADLAGPGGAVTLALCGAFDHPPPCPVAPHHTRAERRDDESAHRRTSAPRRGGDPQDTRRVAVRVLFAVEPAAEVAVRARIDAALAGGVCDGPDGTRTRWRLRSSAPGVVTEQEGPHAARLAAD